jgi:hypothetical protein
LLEANIRNAEGFGTTSRALHRRRRALDPDNSAIGAEQRASSASPCAASCVPSAEG